MKLELYGLIQSILEAGGKFDGGVYFILNSDTRLHREDGPAIVFPDGSQEWYRNGDLHREDGPAVINPDGEQYWYRNGKCHRDDGPARIWPDGRQEWYRNGARIR